MHDIIAVLGTVDVWSYKCIGNRRCMILYL